MTRPSLSATYQPSPHEQFGLNDLQVLFLLTPHSADVWIWGAGPIFQFPTATSDALGTGRWSAGPAAALIYSKGPWFNSVLAYQLMSLPVIGRAEASTRLTWNHKSVTILKVDGMSTAIPQMTFDWTADSASGWTIRIGADVGEAFNVRSHAMSLQLGAYYLSKRPSGAPQ